MKAIEHDLRYDGASAEQVYSMLGDRAFREEVCDLQGVLSRTVTVTTDGGGMSVRIEQTQGTDNVPSLARKFVGEEIDLVQEEQWSSPGSATVRISIPGKAGDMAGEMRIVEDDAGATQTVRMSVKISVPLVGGRIEAMIADVLVKALRAEHQVGREWLARH